MFALVNLMFGRSVSRCRENLPAVLSQSDRSVRAAEEAGLPAPPLPRPHSTQVSPSSPAGRSAPRGIESRCPFCSPLSHRDKVLLRGAEKQKCRPTPPPPPPRFDVCGHNIFTTFSLLRRFALTTKIPDTKGCHKCCIGERPPPPDRSAFIDSPFHQINLCQHTGNVSDWGGL